MFTELVRSVLSDLVFLFIKLMAFRKQWGTNSAIVVNAADHRDVHNWGDLLAGAV